VEQWKKVTMPELRKTVLTGEDSHHWLIVEFFVHPELPRLQAENIWKKLIDAGREQCQADEVQFWGAVEESLVEKFKGHGFEVKSWMEIGTVRAAAMKLDVNK
jgi:hypothetical protein